MGNTVEQQIENHCASAEVHQSKKSMDQQCHEPKHVSSSDKWVFGEQIMGHVGTFFVHLFVALIGVANTARVDLTPMFVNKNERREANDSAVLDEQQKAPDETVFSNTSQRPVDETEQSLPQRRHIPLVVGLVFVTLIFIVPFIFPDDRSTAAHKFFSAADDFLNLSSNADEINRVTIDKCDTSASTRWQSATRSAGAVLITLMAVILAKNTARMDGFRVLIALSLGIHSCQSFVFEEMKLHPRLAADHFGYSVSISGDTVVVGAYKSDDNGTDSGSAYVYQRNGTVWVEQQKLLASDAAAYDYFGHSVAISGQTAVIGAWNHSQTGSAYVYQRNGLVWVEQQKLLASDANASDWFGYSVSISGDTTVVGAPLNDDNGKDSGSAYVYWRNGSVWGQQQQLWASDAAGGDRFGHSVSISGDTALVGAPVNGGNSGSAYVYQRKNGSVWEEQPILLASDGGVAMQKLFGNSVSISGDTALVGAKFNDSVYVYQRKNGSVWEEQQKLLASDVATNDGFGHSVSISGDSAVVGAVWNSDNGTESGSAYIYQRKNGLVWVEQKKILASDAVAYDWFGFSVAISGNTAVVGLGNSNLDWAAYVFSTNGSSKSPSKSPTSNPSQAPSTSPTSHSPTSHPSQAPSTSPTSRSPTSRSPTKTPSHSPLTPPPSPSPTNAPSQSPNFLPVNFKYWMTIGNGGKTADVIRSNKTVSGQAVSAVVITWDAFSLKREDPVATVSKGLKNKNVTVNLELVNGKVLVGRRRRRTLLSATLTTPEITLMFNIKTATQALGWKMRDLREPLDFTLAVQVELRRVWHSKNLTIMKTGFIDPENSGSKTEQSNSNPLIIIVFVILSVVVVGLVYVSWRLYQRYSNLEKRQTDREAQVDGMFLYPPNVQITTTNNFENQGNVTLISGDHNTVPYNVVQVENLNMITPARFWGDDEKHHRTDIDFVTADRNQKAYDSLQDLEDIEDLPPVSIVARNKEAPVRSVRANLGSEGRESQSQQIPLRVRPESHVVIPGDDNPYIINPETNIVSVADQMNRGNCAAHASISAYINTCNRMPNAPLPDYLEMLRRIGDGNGVPRQMIELLEDYFQMGVRCKKSSRPSGKTVVTSSVILMIYTIDEVINELSNGANKLEEAPRGFFENYKFPDDWKAGGKPECVGHGVLVESFNFKTGNYRCKNSWGPVGSQGRFEINDRAAYCGWVVVKHDEEEMKKKDWYRDVEAEYKHNGGNPLDENNWFYCNEIMATYCHEIVCRKLREPTDGFTHLALHIDKWIEKVNELVQCEQNGQNELADKLKRYLFAPSSASSVRLSSTVSR